MIQFWTMAWRNLWRNRRRTMITLASVLMAVMLAVGMRSFQIGAYENMIANTVRFSTGYLQVHGKGWWEDKSIERAFVPSPRMNRSIRGNSNISCIVPQLQSYALAASGPKTKGVEVMGIDPEMENSMNGLAGRIRAGRYLQMQDHGVLVGDGLARYLNLRLGDTLVLLGQGYHAATAAGQYRVQGIFHYPIDRLDNSLVYLSLPEAGTLFDVPGMLTSISMMVQRPAELNRTIRSLRSSVDSNLEVMGWQKMNTALVEEIQGDNAGGIIMLGILYLVVAFGVFGTLLMMTIERKREFAVMIAVGMHRLKLMALVFLETFLMGCLGIATGYLVVLPVVVHFHHHPVPLSGEAAAVYQQFGIQAVMPATLQPVIFLDQGLTVLCIVLVSAFYPLWYVSRLPLTENLKQ